MGERKRRRDRRGDRRGDHRDRPGEDATFDGPEDRRPLPTWGFKRRRTRSVRPTRAATDASSAGASSACASSTTKRFFLRPVDGKGLLPIPLHAGKTTAVGCMEAFGAVDERLSDQHVDVLLEMDPVPQLIVEANFRDVFIKYRTGQVKRLPHMEETILEEGSILYLDFDWRRNVPLFGYVLTEDTPLAKEVQPDEVIEILDVSDEEVEVEMEVETATGATTGAGKVKSADYRTGDSTAAADPLSTSWTIIETEDDMSQLTTRQAKYITKTLGIDTSGFLEKSDFVRALEDLKETGRAEWLSRRRRAEEARAAEQMERSRLEKRRRKLEAEERKQRLKALRRFESLTVGANLKVFLQRIGAKVDVRARCTRADLRRPYRDTMLRYHPDKVPVSATHFQRVLAGEITKWVNKEWSGLA